MPKLKDITTLLEGQEGIDAIIKRDCIEWMRELAELEKFELTQWRELSPYKYKDILAILGQGIEQSDTADNFTRQIEDAVYLLFKAESLSENAPTAIIDAIANIRSKLAAVSARTVELIQAKNDREILKPKIKTVVDAKEFLQKTRKILSTPRREKILPVINTLTKSTEKQSLKQGMKTIALLGQETQEKIEATFEQTKNTITYWKDSFDTILKDNPINSSEIFDTVRIYYLNPIQKELTILTTLLGKVIKKDQDIVHDFRKVKTSFAKPIESNDILAICQEIEDRAEESKQFILKIAGKSDLPQITEAMDHVILALRCLCSNLPKLTGAYEREKKSPYSELNIQYASQLAEKEYNRRWGNAFKNMIRALFRMPHLNNKTLWEFIKYKERNQLEIETAIKKRKGLMNVAKTERIAAETNLHITGQINSFLNSPGINLPKETYAEFIKEQYLLFILNRQNFTRNYPATRKSKDSEKRDQITLTKKSRTKEGKEKLVKVGVIEQYSIGECLEIIRNSVNFINEKCPEEA